MGRGSAIEFSRRAKQHVAQIDDATTDISSYKVLVHAFKTRREKNMARQYRLAKSWSKAFDLIFDFLHHIYL